MDSMEQVQLWAERRMHDSIDPDADMMSIRLS